MPGSPGPWAPAPPGHRHAAASRSWTLPALLAFLGAILLVAGVFTPWFEGDDGAYPSRTGWELVSKKTSELSPFESTPDPAMLLGIGVAVIVVGGLLLSGTAPAFMRLLLAAAGIGTAVILVIDYLSIKDTVKDSFQSGTNFTYQYGFWVCVVAAVVLLLAAVMPSQSRR